MAETQPKPKIHELTPYSLFTPVEGNKRASLSWSLKESYPRITVFTRTPSDNDGKGFISAAFDIEHFTLFLDKLEQVARHNGKISEKVTVKHFPRDATGKITGDREVSAEVWYGKNDEGVVWISVQQPNRPKIAFEILLSDFHEFFNKDGHPATKSEGSVHRTIVMCRILKQKFMDQALTWRDTSVPRPNSLPYSQRPKGPASGRTVTAEDNLAGFDLDADLPF